MTPQDLLRLHPFLGVLTDVETHELLKRALTKHIQADTVVFRKGDPGDGLYGVLAGTVLIVAESTEGKELILNQHDAGEFFGEVALLDGEGRSAAARTREASDLVFLGRAGFLAFLRQRPEAMLRIMALLCARLRRATDLVEDSTFLNVSSRLAKQVIALLDNRKGNANHLLARIGAGLRAQGAAETPLWSKPIFSRPAPEPIVAEIAARCDAVVTAIGD